MENLISLSPSRKANDPADPAGRKIRQKLPHLLPRQLKQVLQLPMQLS